jgi:hypothetical protein
MGNQIMAVQYDHMHEAMAKAKLFEDLDDDSADTKEINDGYSPLPKNVKLRLLSSSQVKRDFDDSYMQKIK